MQAMHVIVLVLAIVLFVLLFKLAFTKPLRQCEPPKAPAQAKREPAEAPDKPSSAAEVAEPTPSSRKARKRKVRQHTEGERTEAKSSRPETSEWNYGATVPDCPNANNPYHTCTPYCFLRYGKGQRSEELQSADRENPFALPWRRLQDEQAAAQATTA